LRSLKELYAAVVVLVIVVRLDLRCLLDLIKAAAAAGHGDGLNSHKQIWQPIKLNSQLCTYIFQCPFRGQFQMGDYLVVVVYIVADVIGKIILFAVHFFEGKFLKDLGRSKFLMIFFFLLFEDFEHI